MANNDIQHFFPDHSPVTRATVPTGDGIFPLHPRSQGGRKRRPFIDLRVHDAQVRMDGTANLLDFAWAIIAKAYGGDWSQAPDNWRAAAETFKDRYHADLGQIPGAVVGDPVVLGAHQERQLDAIRAAAQGAHTPAVAVQEAAAPKESLDAFLGRLSAVPPTVAMNEIPGWDGLDETFVEAATKRWHELNPSNAPTPLVVLQAPVQDAPATGGPIPDGPRTLVGEAGPETVRVIDKPDAQGLRPVASRHDPEDDAETQNLGIPGASNAKPERVVEPTAVVELAPKPTREEAGQILQDVVREIAAEEGIRAQGPSLDGLDLTPPDTKPDVQEEPPAVQDAPPENVDSGSPGETLEGQGKTDVETPGNPQAPSTSDPGPGSPETPSTPAVIPPPTRKKTRPSKS